MKKLFLLLQVLCMFFIAGCIAPEEELPLVGKTYRLTDAGGHYAQITFNKDNTISGFAGVNRFFGNYKVGGDQIIFMQMGMTRMAGAPEAMKFEDKFMSALSKTSRFYEIGRTLTFFDGEMPIFTLKLTEQK